MSAETFDTNSSARSNPVVSQDDTLGDAPLGAVWERNAEDAVLAVEKAIEPRLRQTSAAIYEDLLLTVQDYLLDNVIHNVRQQIAAADRQALHDRRRLDEVEGEFGYEPGEFTVYPEHWRPAFDRGLTPLQAFGSALDALGDARRAEEAERAANWERIKAEDAALLASLKDPQP